jgi:diguanylate cyclase (GGDEF)-like protein/PAS domain S-box-containing protein
MAALKKKSPIHLNKDFCEALVGLCPDAIIGIDRKGRITIFNEAAEELTGYTAAEVVNTLHVTQLYHPPETARQIKKLIYRPDRDGVGRARNIEVTLKTRKGQLVPILVSAAVLFDNDTEVGSLGYFHDLTHTKHLEEISITDNLTGLHNRHNFHSVLAKELERSTRYHRPLTLVYLDLDNFKPFNDNFGHSLGDNILRLVGKCTRQLLRTQDDAFRLGGDEFALLLVETDLDSGTLVAERFRQAFNEQWSRAMSATAKHTGPISISIGLAQYNFRNDRDEPGENADNLLMRADMAMYEAKRAGGNRVVRAGPYIGEKTQT